MTLAALLGLVAILCGVLILLGVGSLVTLAGVGLIAAGFGLAVGGTRIA